MTKLFRLDAASGVPFYRQIIEQVLLAVAKAYREMEIRGIVETQQGTGTFVSTRRADRRPAERKKALEGLVDRFVALATSGGFSLEELAEALVERAEKSTEKSGKRA